ncbi:MAG: RNA polymerase sigma factor, partial [Planctomycetales bacterium]
MSNAPTTPDVAQLVSDHHAELYRYAYRLTGSVNDAEDLTQQTFLQAQANLHQLRDRERARSWLFTILRNCYQMD